MSDTPIKQRVAAHRAHNDAFAKRLGVEVPPRLSARPPTAPPAATLAEQTADSFARVRATLSEVTSRVDAALGETELVRAIEAIRPRLTEIADPELRAEIDLVLEACAKQLRGKAGQP